MAKSKRTAYTPPIQHPLEDHDQVYIDAKTGSELFGIALKPYSPSRKVAAQSMGCLYPYIGPDAAEQMTTTGIYPGALKDTIIVLWLCSLEDASDQTLEQIKAGEWNPSRANQKPSQALEAAIEWAGELEFVQIGVERFSAAYAAFMTIVTAIEKSKFTVSVEGATGGDDSGPKI